ncbi:MAG TPA: hypothetical protein VGB18_06115 [Candidatus Thermoplasmatota archaeon]
MTSLRTAYLGLGALMLLFVIIPAMASAKMEGPCQATIAGADMTQVDVVTVQSGQAIDYSFSAPSPVASYDMQLMYGPYSASPSQGTVEDSETLMVSGTVPLEDYAWLGVGLYQLKGTITLQDGSICTGSMQVDVEGNPLTTAVGATAAVVSGSTTIGLLLLFAKDAGFLFH